MRMLATFLIVIAAVYFWDVQYNNETLSDGARSAPKVARSVRLDRRALCGIGRARGNV